MSISKTLVALFVSFAIAILFSARGLVHSAQGMDDGPARNVALPVANADLALAQVFHLTWPWDEMESALGRQEQLSSPLLSTSVTHHHKKSSVAGSGGAGARPVNHRHALPPHLAAVTPASPRHPLRLLVTGDSLTEFMGPDLDDAAANAGSVLAFTDTHYGTGLVRPDFVDWSLVARQQLATYRPKAIVVLVGGNDFQNMTRANGSIIYTGTVAWTREYQRRAEVCMRIWAQGGKARVYWLSMPPARDSAWTANNRQIDLALQRAAKQVPGAEYLNVLGPVTLHGRYSDFVPVNGVPTLVRTPDGIHFTPIGSQIIANEVLHVLEKQWRFGPYARTKKHRHARS